MDEVTLALLTQDLLDDTDASLGRWRTYGGLGILRHLVSRLLIIDVLCPRQVESIDLRSSRHSLVETLDLVIVITTPHLQHSHTAQSPYSTPLKSGFLNVAQEYAAHPGTQAKLHLTICYA